MDNLSILADISPLGVLTVFIICLLLAFVIFLLVRYTKLKIVKGNLAIENQSLAEKTSLIQDSYKNNATEMMAVLRATYKKQTKYAKHSFNSYKGELREIIKDKFKITDENEKTIVWLLVEILTRDLMWEINENFTDNAIGSDHAEIAKYTKIRASEFSSIVESILDDYDWTLPNYKLKDCLKKLPEDFWFNILLEIYENGKALEYQSIYLTAEKLQKPK